LLASLLLRASSNNRTIRPKAVAQINAAARSHRSRCLTGARRAASADETSNMGRTETPLSAPRARGRRWRAPATASDRSQHSAVATMLASQRSACGVPRLPHVSFCSTTGYRTSLAHGGKGSQTPADPLRAVLPTRILDRGRILSSLSLSVYVCGSESRPH
jgi:hypothetical protein